MNPWQGLLESLHSALIDELTERDPAVKPELGMPGRRPRWDLPEGASGAIVCVADYGDTGTGAGVAALAWGPGTSGRGPGASTAREVWDALLKRAAGELSRRGLKPRFATPAGPGGGAGLPPGASPPGRVIWIPLRAPDYAYFLGIGAP